MFNLQGAFGAARPNPKRDLSELDRPRVKRSPVMEKLTKRLSRFGIMSGRLDYPVSEIS